MRVSKADGSQTLDLQRDALLAAGIEPGHLYQDQASGKRDNRPGLVACFKALRQGNTLVAWKLDRLGRDLRHLVNLVHDLTRREVGLKILAGQGAQLDTTTAAATPTRPAKGRRGRRPRSAASTNRAFGPAARVPIREKPHRHERLCAAVRAPKSL